MDNSDNMRVLRIWDTTSGVRIKKSISVTEKVYFAYMDPIWIELRNKERRSRCMVSTNKHTLKRCTKNCSTCQHSRTGTPLSLDQTSEDGERKIDPPDPRYNADYTLLHIEISKLDPEEQFICECIMYNVTDREAAIEMGVCQSTYNYRKKKLLARLREKLADYC